MTTSATDMPSPDLASFIEGLEHDGQIVACEQHRIAIAEVVELLRSGATIDELPDRLFDTLYAMLECDACHTVFEHVFDATLRAADIPDETAPLVFRAQCESFDNRFEVTLLALKSWTPDAHRLRDLSASAVARTSSAQVSFHEAMVRHWSKSLFTAHEQPGQTDRCVEPWRTFPASPDKLIVYMPDWMDLAEAGRSPAIVTSHSACTWESDWEACADIDEGFLERLHEILCQTYDHEYDSVAMFEKISRMLHDQAVAIAPPSQRPGKSWLTDCLWRGAVLLTGAGSTRSEPLVRGQSRNGQIVEQPPSGQKFVEALLHHGDWRSQRPLNAALLKAYSKLTNRVVRPPGRTTLLVEP